MNHSKTLKAKCYALLAECDAKLAEIAAREVDPNQCPCTTGHESFDGMTLGELGALPVDIPDLEEDARIRGVVAKLRGMSAEYQQARPFQEDGHLEVDDWYRLHPERDC